MTKKNLQELFPEITDADLDFLDCEEEEFETCWYPSAGVDIKNIQLWHSMAEAEKKPRVFFFTDLAYHLHNTLGYQVEPENEEYVLQIGMQDGDIQLETFTSLGAIENENIFLPETFDKSHPMYKMLYTVCIGENPPQEIIIQALLVIGLHDGLTVQLRKELADKVTPMSAVARCFNRKNPTLIIFIEITNTSFLKILLKNKIKVDSIMISRPMDYTFGGFWGMLDVKEIMCADNGTSLLQNGEIEIKSLKQFAKKNTPFRFEKSNTFIWKARNIDGSDTPSPAALYNRLHV